MFEAIVVRYRGALLRDRSALLGRERAAQDAVQQTFVKAYNAMKRDDRPLALELGSTGLRTTRPPMPSPTTVFVDQELDEAGATAERPELELERREQLCSAPGLGAGSPPRRQRDALILRELEEALLPGDRGSAGVGGGPPASS